MQTSEHIGNVTITYSAEDYSKDNYRKSYNKMYLGMGAIIVVGILITVAISMFLEYICQETWISIITMVVGTIASVILSLVYISRVGYLETKVWDILNWLTSCPDIEAGYFNGRIILLVKSNSYRLTSILDKSGVEYTVDETQVKDKSQPIAIECDFTNKFKTIVKVLNTEVE